MHVFQQSQISGTAPLPCVPLIPFCRNVLHWPNEEYGTSDGIFFRDVDMLEERNKKFLRKAVRSRSGSAPLEETSPLVQLEWEADDGKFKQGRQESADRHVRRLLDYWLTPITKVRILIEVAEGMRYLHNETAHKQAIAHHDLKPKNVLLMRYPRSKDDGELVVKLCDFGEAIRLPRKGTDGSSDRGVKLFSSASLNQKTQHFTDPYLCPERLKEIYGLSAVSADATAIPVAETSAAEGKYVDASGTGNVRAKFVDAVTPEGWTVVSSNDHEQSDDGRRIGLSQRQLSFSQDIYAFGVTMYEV